MFICFDACKKGWRAGCRPLIGVDGYFLKRICKGQLLTTIGIEVRGKCSQLLGPSLTKKTQETGDGS